MACHYIDNSTYQENLLTKYQKQLGHEIYIIASTVNQDNGRLITENESRSYQNEYRIYVTRLKYKANNYLSKKLCALDGLYKEIEKIKPEIIFIHGLQSIEISTVIRYLKIHPNIKVYVDNHVDFMNSAKNFFSRELLHKLLWKRNAKRISPYVSKFYGVLPARVDFLTEVYNVPVNKAELLVLGVDDDLLNDAIQNNSRERIREGLHLSEDKILIVTGGKINSDRPETLNLMESIANINRPDIQLLVFGTVIDELKQKFEELCQSPYIHYVGWIDSKHIYEFFQAGDLIAFPGLHSVLWEQAVGSGKACIFRKMNGFTHIDLGGNCSFFEETTVESMEKQIINLVDDNKILKMTQIAQDKGKKFFSYKEIAKRCIED
jgi:hypothetical protein